MNDLVALLSAQGAAVVFLATLATRLGAPVPAAPFLIVAGGLAVGGQLSFIAVLLAAVLGNILGDGAWFLAGRRWGYRVMRFLCRISLSADTCVRRSESILGRWGGLSLIAAKFVPGVSVVAPPMAGALGMSNTRFMAYETLAALIWSLGFLALGGLFHGAIQDVLAVMSSVGLTATLVGTLLLAAFVAWRYRERRIARQVEDIEHVEVGALREALAVGARLMVVDLRSVETRKIDDRAVPGAVGITYGELDDRLAELQAERELVVFCDCPNDETAIAAARLLSKAGLPRVRVLAGGIAAWAAAEALDSQPAPLDANVPPAVAAHPA
ncbi:VTT domain-containing protein [Variovorax guangxiensis]|uniref:VTT domain-containing protein n=1 Tax=Variovorax guangxiensis TaxID=1775474 RepID=UPI00285ADA78|nr:VTT domain-containing protein [Variovorax guangxiensis]MDR6858213.1 membrane protein DedA with SNARE-associated domain/rhodanese-related sulfurtransferase [Variovorax guangxiensis]